MEFISGEDLEFFEPWHRRNRSHEYHQDGHQIRNYIKEFLYWIAELVQFLTIGYRTRPRLN